MDATGSGNMFKCCSNFLDIPDEKDDIEKLHKLATEKEVITHGFHGTIIDDGKPVNTVMIRKKPKAVNDLPQFKYTYALKSFNAFNAKGPVDLLDDINKRHTEHSESIKTLR